ncbi:hypothetical protein G9G63_10245 [Paenibacillus sp. EKM202P]|uniref:hypothetical protein n=1 Tax=unclassified Paenibacillus TaxID=185978 RepID=UPI0013EAE357|nr:MULTISPECIES: hypothetical protein [unclassified Paenibacillus]KAF6564514.1 hypothetical protein G9G63_10245 [Paenibacillus sp. EKM202P]KAF6571671.1 hypothetical protein G9G64_06530 [Paenibacillus sp. EKM207P]
MEMTIERFTELLDEKIFELAKEMRDEYGLHKLVINQDSNFVNGTITVRLSEKGKE